MSLGCFAAHRKQPQSIPGKEILNLQMDDEEFTDSGPNSMSVLKIGTVSLNTSVQRIGTGCAFLNPGYLTIAAPATRTFVLDGPFLIDGWVRGPGDYNRNTVLSVGHYTDGLLFRAFDNSTSDVWVCNRGVNLPTVELFPKDIWTYFAFTRDANWTVSFYIAVNGGNVERKIQFYNLKDVINSQNNNVMIGAAYHFNGGHQWNGYIDAFRMSSGFPYDLKSAPFKIENTI